MGLIYMIHVPSGKKYIGQHNRNTLNKRKKSHFNGFKKFQKQVKNGKNPNKIGGCPALYKAFMKYGFDKCVFVVMEKNIPNDKLNEIEDNYILEYKTLVPNGYNLRLNDSTKYNGLSEETLRLISENRRRNPVELDGMPMYVAFVQRNGRRGYRIQGHPNCEFKDFLSSTESLEELKKKALDFLKEIENKLYVSTYQVKAQAGIPKGILDKPTGYEIQVQRNGMNFNKMFTKSSISKQENLRLAIEWIAKLDAEIAKPANEANLDQFISDRAKKVIPKGITKYKNGYRVVFNQNKIRYDKSFTSNTISDDELLQRAIEWMNNKKEEIKNTQKIMS